MRPIDPHGDEMSDLEAFDHSAVDQVLVDNLVDILSVDVAVPHPLRVDHQHRPLRTAVKTTRGIDSNLPLAREPTRLDLLFCVIADLGRPKALTALAIAIALVGAEENMVSVVHGR